MGRCAACAGTIEPGDAICWRGRSYHPRLACLTSETLTPREVVRAVLADPMLPAPSVRRIVSLTVPVAAR